MIKQLSYYLCVSFTNRVGSQQSRTLPGFLQHVRLLIWEIFYWIHLKQELPKLDCQACSQNKNLFPRLWSPHGENTWRHGRKPLSKAQEAFAALECEMTGYKPQCKHTYIQGEWCLRIHNFTVFLFQVISFQLGNSLDMESSPVNHLYSSPQGHYASYPQALLWHSPLSSQTLMWTWLWCPLSNQEWLDHIFSTLAF